MPVSVKVEDSQVRIELGELRGAVTDVRPLLGIAGEVMRGSIAQTFRDEGSPAGSWPKLAISTMLRRGYSAGHKLLILSGRLFGSIAYTTAGNTLTIGTNVVYAAVHQFGSSDYRGNFTGPLTREQHMAAEMERVHIAAHGSSRPHGQRYGTDLRTDKRGVVRRVHVKMIGPRNATRFQVKGHERHQNIPPRPYLVFRPEDPSRIAEGLQTYFDGFAIAKAGAQ